MEPIHASLLDASPTTDHLPGVEYSENSNPTWYTSEEIFDKLGGKLIAHYGEDFRKMLNASRAERGLRPL
jgi:hypothetical protein